MSTEKIFIKDIRKELFKYFSDSDKSFDLAKPTGLANPNIPVAYNPSAGFLEIKDYVHTDKKLPLKKFYVNEKCFRHIDMNLVGTSKRHLSFFEMFAFFIAGHKDSIEQQKIEEELIQITTDLLLNKFKLKCENVIVTLFGGGNVANISNIPSEERLISLWNKYGIPKSNIVPTQGLRNFVANYQWGYAGTSYEIFYKQGNTLLEIASTNKYKYKVEKLTRKNKVEYSLKPSFNFAYGTGFGLERLSATLNQKNDIFDIPELCSPIELLRSFLPTKLEKIEVLDNEHLKQIVDGIRSIIFIMSEGIRPSGSHSRERILKKIIKNVLEELNYLGLYDQAFEIISKISKDINKNYQDYYELRIDDTLAFLKDYISSMDVSKKYSHLMQSS